MFIANNEVYNLFTLKWKHQILRQQFSCSMNTKINTPPTCLRGSAFCPGNQSRCSESSLSRTAYQLCLPISGKDKDLSCKGSASSIMMCKFQELLAPSLRSSSGRCDFIYSTMIMWSCSTCNPGLKKSACYEMRCPTYGTANLSKCEVQCTSLEGALQTLKLT